MINAHLSVGKRSRPTPGSGCSLPFLVGSDCCRQLLIVTIIDTTSVLATCLPYVLERRFVSEWLRDVDLEISPPALVRRNILTNTVTHMLIVRVRIQFKDNNDTKRIRRNCSNPLPLIINLPTPLIINTPQIWYTIIYWEYLLLGGWGVYY